MLRAAFLSLLLFSFLDAKDFGIYHEVYLIIEESLDEALSRASKEELEKGQRQFRKKLKAKGFKPEGKIYPRATQARQRFFDPSISLEEDLYDLEGKLLLAKGKKANPLDFITLDEGLLIFDAEDSDQVAWAREQAADYLWLITNGDPFKLREEEKKEVYFDQLSQICQKLEIEVLPVSVLQEGALLRIEEFELV